MPSFSIIIPSCGRPSLITTLASITPQMLPGDELLVDVNDDGNWGAAARTRMIAKATRDALIFFDDDDKYVEGAFEVMRAAFATAPDRVHIFRLLRSDGVVNWQTPKLKFGNVGSGMWVVPNIRAKLGTWGDGYSGDLHFIRQTCAKMGEPVWHKDVIYLYSPHAE